MLSYHDRTFCACDKQCANRFKVRECRAMTDAEHAETEAMANVYIAYCSPGCKQFKQKDHKQDK